MSQKNRKFWEFTNKSDKQAELLLYGNISETSWWGDEVTPKLFLKELNDLGTKDEIVVRINSSGGDVFAAYAIATNLKDNSAKIIGKIDGIAASAATVIMAMCDEVWAAPYIETMIHNPSSICFGEAKDFTKMADVLNNIKDGIINAYIMKTNMTREELSKIMDEETWLTGAEAAELGFVDKLMFVDDEPEKYLNSNRVLVFNSVQHDLSQFKKIPSEFINLMSNSSNNQSSNNQASPDINKNPKGGQKVEIKNVEELTQAYPDLVSQIMNSAKETGAKEERARLQAIDDIADNLDGELVVNAKYGEKVMDAKELAFEAIKNDQSKGNKYLGDKDNDINNSGAKNVTPDGTVLNTQEEKDKEIINAMVAGANEGRNQ